VLSPTFVEELRPARFGGWMLIIVATVHVFEALSIFPAAGWGRPGSVGHYVDLGAAVLGTLFLSGAIAAGLSRQRVK
jgi:hypothetical protein